MRAAYGRNGGKLDLIQRYRGVAVVLSVPVLLIAAVLLLMPRSSPYAGDFNRSQPFSRSRYENPGAEGGAQYAIVIDAGSTGSRVHVFKFNSAKGQLELEFDKFEQLKPGLSSFASEPKKAPLSLKPLLDLALQTVPKKQHAATHIMVGATAGLRLLPDGKADIILDEVRSWLKTYPFAFDPAADVKILSGVDEGAFAWLTLNYLLGHLGKEEHSTVAAIDLGGGSVQEAYAMTAEEAKAAPDASYVSALKGGGRRYSVYVYSYLGYGLMAGRAAVLSEVKDQREHPCIPKGYSGEFEYGGKKMAMVGHSSGSSNPKCAAVVLDAIKHEQECGAPKPQCTFNGAWGGSHLPSVFYISSYFWDRATDAGIISDPSAIQQKVSPSDFGRLAAKVCEADVAKLGADFPHVQESLLPFFCLDLSYVHTLLTDGFDIPETSSVTLVKKVQYKEEQIEAAWPLGAAINMLG